MSLSSVHVFNQYYFDLLKKVKDVARDMKHKNEDKVARDVLREIKRYYLSFDKASEQYVQWYRENMKSLDEAIGTPEFDDQMWYQKDEWKSLQLYQGITLDMLCNLIRSKDVLLYYFILLSMFATENMEDEQVGKLVEVLKTKQISSEAVASFESNALQSKLVLLSTIQSKQTQNTTSKPEDMFAGIESTTLGKLAKEIMNEVNMEEIQQTVGDDGDIMKALGNPDSGITKLLGTVSQKMISKMASGELRQETLLQDAMKFASCLPNMGMKGGSGNSGGLGDMGSMLDSVSQLASMFGGGDLSSMMQQFAGGMKAPKGTKTQVNSSAVNRVAKAKQLRRKLEERRKTKENID